MIKEESRQAVDRFLRSAEKSMTEFCRSQSAGTYEAAAELIAAARKNGGRLHVTGIGKPGHVAAYAASLFSSTGAPCYFLHGTEAVHGSCGQLAPGDLVIAISNSGETGELKATVCAVQNNGCKVIGVTGGTDSWLAKHSDVCLYAGVAEEGGPLDRAPRNSILAELLVLQALSVMLQVERGWDAGQYVRCHPGGALGQLRESER